METKSNLQRVSETAIGWIIRYPKQILFSLLIVIIALASGVMQLSISNDFRVYLSDDNPQLLAFESFESNYVKSDSATFVITAKESDLFNQQGLTLIEELTERAWLISGSYRVTSISNYQITQSVDDEIRSELLVENAQSLSPVQIISIKQRALSEKRLIHSLLTADGKMTVIVINLRLPKTDTNASIKITKEMQSVRQQFQQKYPSFDIANGGSTAFNATLAEAVEQDLTTLMPLSFFVIFLGLLLFLRNFYGVAAIFLLISTSLLVTFGFFGWVSPVLTPIAGFAPSILLSIMVADSVHLLTTYFQQIAQGETKHTAIKYSLQLNFMPIVVTSITTIVGFLSLNLSASPPYQALGNMVAFGVLVALIFSLVLLPCLLILMPIKKQSLNSNHQAFDQLANFIINSKIKIIIAVTAAVILLASLIPNNKLSDNWANYFDDSFSIVKLVQRIDGYLTGVNALEYSFESTTSKGIFDPEYLKQLDNFEQWYLSQDKVVKVNSLALLLKDINQVMHNDNPNWYKVPKSSELAAQYLLFYEFGLPEGLGLDNLITIHKDASRFSVSMTDAGSDELLAIDQKAQQWLIKNAPAIKATTATGLGMVFAHIADRNISSLLWGTFLALFAISLILMVVLRSVKYGVISLVPNIIPAVMAYGFWGATFGYVDISLSIVACSTLGIVVDDTVHFLHKYIYARKSGLTPEQAIREAFSRVGLALLTTSVVLSVGFIILAVSHMNTSAAIGILMAITLLFALIVDFLLLPPLLLIFDKDKPDHSVKILK